MANLEKFNFNNLSPFKWFVLNNFPFVDADFDAMTEWQLFQKIGEWINKIIESQNTVGSEMEKVVEAYNELYNYVHDYFKNLDVQDEINNKLNNMAESGELSVLINNLPNVVKKTDTEVITEPMLSQEVKEMISGGSVAVVGIDSVGKPNIINNTVDVLHLDDSISDYLAKKWEYTQISSLPQLSGMPKNNSGKLTIVSADNLSYCIITPNIGDIYYINGTNYYQGIGICVVDSDNNILLNSNPNANLSGNCYEIFRINKTGCKIYVLTEIQTDFNTNNELKYSRKLINTDIILNGYNSEIETNLIKKYDNRFVNSATIGSNVSFSGLNENDEYCVYIYPMIKGVKYKLTGPNYYNATGIVLTNLNNKVMYSSYSADDKPESVITKTYEFVAETDGFIILSKALNVEPTIEKLTNNPKPLTTDYLYYNLIGKKIGFIGDSVCLGVGGNNTGKSYAGFIADILGCESVKIAQGGATIKKIPDNNNCIQEFVKQLPKDCDIVVVNGGINDFWTANSILGDFNKDRNTKNEDITTITGGLEFIFSYIYENIKCPIIYCQYHISKAANPNSLSVSTKFTYEELFNRIRDICEKYGVTYCNIEESGLNMFFEDIFLSYRLNESEETGIHPNDEGYKKYYVPMIINSIVKLNRKDV